MRLAELKQDHADLDAAIASLSLSPLPDMMLIGRLKRKKLGLKDEIARVAAQAAAIARANRRINTEPITLAPVEAYRTTWRTPVVKNPFDMPVQPKLDLLLQIQADELQVPVARPVIQETTALGAAYLAGLAEGVWQSTDEIAAAWQLDRRCEPRAGVEAIDARRQRWLRAVERSRDWARTG